MDKSCLGSWKAVAGHFCGEFLDRKIVALANGKNEGYFVCGPCYVSDVLNCKSGVFGRKGGFVCM